MTAENPNNIRDLHSASSLQVKGGRHAASSKPAPEGVACHPPEGTAGAPGKVPPGFHHRPGNNPSCMRANEKPLHGILPLKTH